ncbi:MAG: hypothetical protein ACRCYC_05575 [Paraclostridium sp.]|uniref:hypothetical protein n=1 Tax=Paraclostridium sp. TaxID=2023273 RepID=UPI003F40CEB9
MNFWREKRKRIYFIVIAVFICFIGQYFLFKYGVISPLVKGIELSISKGNYIQNIDEYVIKLGDSIKISSGKYIIIPPYASDPKIEYKASHNDILDVKGDTITGVKEGYSAIMITKDGRAIRKATIRVVKPKVESLDVAIGDLKYVGDSSPIDVSVDVDFDFHDKEKYTYEVSNEDVLKIEDNTLKAIGVGKSKLYIRSGDKVKEYNFNIQAKVSEIYVNDSINIRIDEEKNIDAKVETSPKNLKHPKITYELVGFKMPIARAISLSTSDGTIKGIREGTEKIKVTCGGKSKIITVNVLKESVESKQVQNLDATSTIVGDNLEITLKWDYLEDIEDYEVYLKNNSLGDKDFSLSKSVKINKEELGKDKKIKTKITVNLKDIQDPNIDIYVVGKSEGKYTQKSNIINISESYKNPDKIDNYQVENLSAHVNEDNSIDISWDKLNEFDCTYSIYIRNNITSPGGGFELYQYGISDNNIKIPINEGEEINLDVYVVAKTGDASSQNSKVLSIIKSKPEVKPETKPEEGL